MDRFGDLSNFVAVVEAGGIGAAADRLNLSKSVVSRRLKALESRLGVELVARTTRTLRVTNEGQVFFERSRQVLADLEEAEAALIHGRTSLSGTLRVSAPVQFGQQYIAPAMNEFIARHDRLTLDLDLVDRHVGLVEEGYDLAIRIGRLPDSGLIARRLCDVEVHVCASPGYLGTHGEPEAIGDLAHHDGLLHRAGATITGWAWTDGTGTVRNAAIRSRMISNDDRVLLAAARDGLGIISIPDFAALPDIRAGRLRRIMADTDWLTLGAYAVYPPTRHLSHRVRSIVDFLVAHVRASGGQPGGARAIAGDPRCR